MNLRKFRFAAVLCLLLCGAERCPPESIMSLVASGFTVLSPASNLFTPGAVVMMQKDDQGRAQMKLICGPRANLGPNFNPRVSDTMSSTYRMSRTQKIELEADAIDRFKARTKVEEVDAVTVSFTRPRVLEVSDESVFENIHNRTEACQRAIDARIDAGFRPTFVTSAFAADVEYTVSFKRERELSKKIREERMGRIAANLGGGHTEVTDHSLRAVNLILAVKAEEYLLSIKPCEGNSCPNIRTRQGLGEPFADALPGSDAPLVPPPNGGWVSPIIGG